MCCDKLHHDINTTIYCYSALVGKRLFLMDRLSEHCEETKQLETPKFPKRNFLYRSTCLSVIQGNRVIGELIADEAHSGELAINHVRQVGVE